VNDRYIRLRSKIYTPDVAVVLDPSLLKIVDPSQGLKPGGLIIINTNKPLDQIRSDFGYKAKLASVDADRIAREELGFPSSTPPCWAPSSGEPRLSAWIPYPTR